MYSPGRHRESTAQEARQAREADDSGGRVRSGEAEDQGDVRHEPVADAEHRCSGTAALHVAVMVLVHLAGLAP